MLKSLIFEWLTELLELISSFGGINIGDSCIDSFSLLYY